MDILSSILERKRREVERRRSHPVPNVSVDVDRGPAAVEALRRKGQPMPHVIAEVKLRSPSAGLIRERRPGLVANIARQYEDGGAAAVSVLCDGPGFGGGVLDLRRAAAATSLPLLFKEFVLDEVQVRLARCVGASMVLLLVRALPNRELERLIRVVRDQGMAPVVEAGDEEELARALQTNADIVGVNARDLRTFHVDPEAARRAVERIPPQRVAVHMSGIRTAEDLAEVAGTRADAVLVGEGLMRAQAPGQQLRQLIAG